MTDMTKELTEVIQRLDALLPELQEGRITHVEWGEWMAGDTDGSRMAKNPDIGDAGFHAHMVEVYDTRIQTVKAARAALLKYAGDEVDSPLAK